ncbi:MAG: aminotransferase class I/II-fold pyridoxal phosphate-dependent enzyme [Brucellaceae bacterium]|nr:aminotransferase class I/II-fold pyridoxal phosphate-dependent enzyme [Brucellaceae bacterium]
MRSRRNAKWSRFGEEVLPAWVAEMDFAMAPPVQEAIAKIVREQDYGYPRRNGLPAGEAVSKAFVARMEERFGWTTSADLVLPLADLVQGTYAPIFAFTDPGDGIILQMPAYPPFHDAINITGRRLIKNQLTDSGERFELDFDAMEASIDETTKMIVLCNPHNPTGRVFSRDDLLRLGQIAIRHGLYVVSDEIHADLAHPGHEHIPFASLSREIAARTITLNSATKSFNIPGLRCAVMHFGDAELFARFDSALPKKLMGQPSIIGIDATVAAWMEGQPWLDSTLGHLTAVRDHIFERLGREIPAVRGYSPEATYMAWLDCSGLDLDRPAFDFFHDEAGVAFSPGETFDAGCSQFVRFNFATSMEIADKIVDRMVSAIGKIDRNVVTAG